MRIIKIALALIIAFSFTTVAYAEEQPKTLNFAVVDDYSTGIDKILYAALKNIGYNLATSPLGNVSATEATNSGEKDGFLVRVSGIEENYKNIVKVEVPLTELEVCVYAPIETNYKINNWNDLSNYKVGMLFQKPALEASLPSGAEVVKYVSSVELMEALVRGECDVALTRTISNTEQFVPKKVKQVTLLERTNGYVYLNKKHAELATELSNELARMKDNGEYDAVLNGTALTNTNNTQHVLYLSSNTYDSIKNIQFREGLDSMLANKSVQIDSVSLNSNLIAYDPARARLIYSMLRSDLVKKTPSAIIVSDQNAFNFLRNEYFILYPKIPVIYCGIPNFNKESLDGFEKYFTGIGEHIPALETVTKMLELFPSTKNIFVINDFTNDGIVLKNEIKSQMLSVKNVNFEYNDNISYANLLTQISSLPADTLVLIGKYISDNTNKAIAEKNSQVDFYKASKGAMFGLTSDALGFGQLGGLYIDSFSQGVAVANLATNILDSTATTTAQEAQNVWKFDYNVMKKFNIKKSQLPNDSQIINLPTNVFKSYPIPIAITIVAIGAAVLIIIRFIIYFRKIMIKGRQLNALSTKLHSYEELIEKDKLIQEERLRLEKILDSSPIIFFSASNGIITNANILADEMLNIKENDSVISFFSQLSYNQQLVDKINDNKSFFGEIALLKLKNGKNNRFYVNTSKLPTSDKNELLFWLIDIEESEVMADLAQKTKEAWMGVLDVIPLPLAICKVDRTRLFVNKAYISIFEFSSLEDALTYNINKLLAPNENRVNAPVSALNLLSLLPDTNTIGTCEELYIRPNGKLMEATIHGRLITFNGERNAIFIIQDVSEEKAKSELLFKIAEEEKAANQLKNRFLISMSHEIRTPMNAIIGLAEIELKKLTSKEMIDVFRKIDLSAKNLLTIMGDILDFSKIEAEEITFRYEEVDIEEVVANALLMASQRIGSKPIEIVLNMSTSLPSRVYADQTRLWQVLKNVMDNAAKYTQKGKITMEITQEGIDQQRRCIICFKIVDTGLGMSETQLERLFRPFEQFHNEAGVKNVGTGLGMVITKQLIELMEGEVFVESQLNLGTTFNISIPFAVPEGSKDIKKTFESFTMSKYNILIADDDPISLQIMCSLLEPVGANPVCVSSGTQAIEEAMKREAEGNPYDLIILDYLMTDINGIEVANILNSKIKSPAKLLLVSAYAKQLLISEIEAAGYEDVIEKPFCPSDFIRKLGKAVDSPTKFTTYDNILFPNANVLLCEDNLINQEVALGILEVFGIVPDVANNGQEGIDLANDKKYDLIFMDILMPIKDGHEATKEIRKGTNSNTPILAMTANVMKDEIDKCFENGMNGHIGKPISFEKVFSKLSEFLQYYAQSKNIQTPVVSTEHQLLQQMRSITDLDIDDGLMRFGKKTKRYATCLLSFADDIISDFEPFETAEPAQLKIKIHTIKGVAGNLGAKTLYQQAADFEKEKTKEQYDAIVATCNQLGTTIKAKLSNVDLTAI